MPITITDMATGAEIVDAIRRFAAQRNLRPLDVARELSPKPSKWLTQLAQAKQPKAETLIRVRALLAGEPVPPPPANNFQASPRKAAAPAAPAKFEFQRAPIIAPIDRDPCKYCGVRGDVGCGCRRAA